MTENENIEKKKRKLKPSTIRANNCKIDVEILENNEDNLRMIIDSTIIMESYERNRTTSKHAALYDPLSTFKKKIIKKIREKLPEDFEPVKGYTDIKMYLSYKIPVSWTIKKSVNAYLGKIKPTREDNDNIEKTTFDILNNLIWEDDSHVYKNYTEKKYGLTESMRIELNITKIKEDYKGNASKEEKELWKTIQK